MNFSDDLYFWIGAGLLLLSSAGIFWILKAMRGRSEPEESGPANFSDFFTPPAPPAGSTPAAPRPAAPPPAAPVSPTIAPVAAAPAVPQLSDSQAPSLEILSQQLERIDQSLQAILRRLEERSASGPNEARAAGNGSSAQIADLSVKVEKIYQVLASLSGSGTR